MKPQGIHEMNDKPTYTREQIERFVTAMEQVKPHRVRTWRSPRRWHDRIRRFLRR